MRKALLFICLTVFLACSTEKEQQKTVIDLAKKDLMIQLQLPEGTKFNDDDLLITEETKSDAGEITTYIVEATVKSQDQDGKEILKTYKLQYEKIGEGGLDPNDYELISFD
jgi:hypothetical protein